MNTDELIKFANKFEKQAQAPSSIENLTNTLTALYSIHTTLHNKFTIQALGDLLNNSKNLQSNNPQDIQTANKTLESLKPIIEYVQSYAKML